MRKKSWLFTSILLSGCIALAGCGNQNASSSAGEGDKQKSSQKAVEIATSGPITINPEIADKKILDKDPFGNPATSAKTLKLTEEEIEKVKEGNYTAAIVMHYTGTDYMTAQINALKTTFKRMGIKVIAVTDAQFKAEKEVSDIETVLAKKPDIIVSVPVDPVSTADAYKKAAAAGVKIVFMDGVANEMKPGKDYVSIVSGDNYGNGVEAAEIMADKLGGKGKIGVIFHDTDFFVTKQRTTAFEETIKKKYPDIKIVTRGGITSPNDGEKVASAMLTRNADLDGIFAVWDVPGEGAVSAARTAGKTDLVITTTDLGTNVGLEMASDGVVKGLGAQLPFDQGIAEAILAGYALLGKEAPPYVTTPALNVTKDNILDSWKLVYRQDAPATIQDAMK
ncbi:sugar ABC transporter substrate-binding protein [Peribacillus cavernae]|uniref:Sugar ABC transporter substrate-binding protein n=1 Tax=Peribacillus cavernae TaxID=1674310 RepID=A0A3S0UF57_9BACI|nr:substrate-binding domain-containing protein [Peribacillus cavernae]MDQ0217424.1 ribose transport system substrate-binding protein [Peribacillus cavernae]RUQ30128.1 sugar ABC transporter substrate-binding protein [Peribacillus cavernae]